MNKQELIKELVIEVMACGTNDIKTLQQTIEHCMYNYNVTKMKETLPSTGDGSTTKYLFEQFTKDKYAQGLSKSTTVVEQVSTEDVEKLCDLVSGNNCTVLKLASDIDTDMEVMIPYSNTTAKALEGNVQSKLNATKLLEIQTALLEMGGLS